MNIASHLMKNNLKNQSKKQEKMKKMNLVIN